MVKSPKSKERLNRMRLANDSGIAAVADDLVVNQRTLVREQRRAILRPQALLGAVAQGATRNVEPRSRHLSSREWRDGSQLFPESS